MRTFIAHLQVVGTTLVNILGSLGIDSEIYQRFTRL